MINIQADINISPCLESNTVSAVRESVCLSVDIMDFILFFNILFLIWKRVHPDNFDLRRKDKKKKWTSVDKIKMHLLNISSSLQRTLICFAAGFGSRSPGCCGPLPLWPARSRHRCSTAGTIFGSSVFWSTCWDIPPSSSRATSLFATSSASII